MSDDASKLLPAAYEGLAKLQGEFNAYQKAGFPARGSAFFALELNGEAGELANLEKKAWKGKEISAARFEDEAADVLIALINYANARRIDLGEAVRQKMQSIDHNRQAGTH